MESKQVFSVRFGGAWVEAAVPGTTMLFEGRRTGVRRANLGEAAIEMALDQPIGCPPIEDMIGEDKRVVILVDDATRPTPARLLLPGILERLQRGGVSRRNVSIVIATGTHRAMRLDEMDAKLGQAVRQAYEVVNHDCRDLGMLVKIGRTAHGTPISINRLVAEAGLVIGIGNIVPHRYCGWAGGAKIVQPGVCGEETTAATHMMMAEDAGVRLGILENRVRHEMEAVADEVNLRFVVNTILNGDGSISGVVAGDVRRAFRAGVTMARGIYTVPIPGRADIVVASASPSDMNFWQAGKALYSADLAAKRGGVIILVSPCYEGVGEHAEFVELCGEHARAIRSRLRADKVRDRIGAAAALAVAEVRSRAEVWIVAENLSSQDADGLRMRRFASLQDAVDAALLKKGRTSRLTVLHEATEILPTTAKEW
ncbi:MAG: nickel-dependent lactate racemase, partial [Chloroflexi bacterium]|nr:nickel-dependent lactate racemase [Chloroflexota bacterium]